MCLSWSVVCCLSGWAHPNRHLIIVYLRVPSQPGNQGNQGKPETKSFTFPVREKSGKLNFCQNHGEARNCIGRLRENVLCKCINYCPKLEISGNNYPGILTKIREISEQFVSFNCWEPCYVSLEDGKCTHTKMQHLAQYCWDRRWQTVAAIMQEGPLGTIFCQPSLTLLTDTNNNIMFPSQWVKGYWR